MLRRLTTSRTVAAVARRLFSDLEEPLSAGEQRIYEILSKTFPKAQELLVKDISGEKRMATFETSFDYFC